MVKRILDRDGYHPTTGWIDKAVLLSADRVIPK